MYFLGMTPQRRVFDYPQHLTHSQPHEKILENFTIDPQLLEIDNESDNNSEMTEVTYYEQVLIEVVLIKDSSVKCCVYI